MHARRPAYRIFAEHFITATVGLKISMNEFTQNVKEVKKKKMCECSLYRKRSSLEIKCL